MIFCKLKLSKKNPSKALLAAYLCFYFFSLESNSVFSASAMKYEKRQERRRLLFFTPPAAPSSLFCESRFIVGGCFADFFASFFARRLA